MFNLHKINLKLFTQQTEIAVNQIDFKLDLY